MFFSSKTELSYKILWLIIVIVLSFCNVLLQSYYTFCEGGLLTIIY